MKMKGKQEEGSGRSFFPTSIEQGTRVLNHSCCLETTVVKKALQKGIPPAIKFVTYVTCCRDASSRSSVNQSSTSSGEGDFQVHKTSSN